MPNTSGVVDQLKLQLPSWVNMMQLTGFSKDFFELVRDIGEAKSKEEEDRIIKNEVQKLKVLMGQPDQAKKMKEYLIRAIYCVMLGHDIPFAYVHALTMTQDPKIYNKRTGYLAVSLLLHENHELLLMVVHSIQKGLLSNNYLEVCSALIALCKLINADTIPAFLPNVVNLLSHPKAAVRKKACMAIHRFWLKTPDSISHLSDKLRVVLCDRDPSVMAASLCLFLDMARVDPVPFKDLIPSFVSILKQVGENRLPRSYEYHSVPAPWIQINLLKLLSLLGADDQSASEHMYEVLLSTMQRAEKYRINSAYAVLYEAINTVTRIRANNTLLEAAAGSIGQLIRVRNHNLKYLGIKALAAIVRVAPRFVVPHQQEVIECLESTDETLKRNTLDLLYRMTNTKNVTVIVAKLIEYLQNTVATEEHVRAELVSRITELAERYAPNNHWYIDTMNVMFHVGGGHVRPEVAYNLIRLISQGTSDNEDEDNQLRQYAVSTFLQSLESSDFLPDIQVQVISWVIGEYGYLCVEDQHLDLTIDRIVTLFADLMERPHSNPTTRSWIITGLLKLVAQLDHTPSSVLSLVQKYTRSRHPDLMMRAFEFLALVHNPTLMVDVLPVDASCEDIAVDTKLSFMDAHSQRGVVSGVFKSYIPREQRKKSQQSGLRLDSPTYAATSTSKKELNFSYPAPTLPSQTLLSPLAITPPTPSAAVVSSPSVATSPIIQPIPEPQAPQGLKVSNVVWTRDGFQGKSTTLPITTPPPSNQPPNLNISTPSTPQPPKTPTPIQSPAVAQVQQPKLNAQQENLARQLFSGLSIGASTGTPDNTLATTSVKSAAYKPRATNRPQQTNTIVSVPTTSTSPASPQPLASPSISKSDEFLIDFADLSASFSSPTLSHRPTASPVASPQISQLNRSTPTPPSPPSLADILGPTTVAPPPATSLLDDNISPALSPIHSTGENLLAPSAPLAGQITPGSNFEVSNLSYTPFLGSLFDGTNSSVYERIGKQDEHLQVGCIKVWKKDETLVVLLVSNKSTKGVTDVVTTVQIPEHFAAELSADPLVVTGNSSFTLSSLPASKTALEVIRLRHKKHGFNLAITAHVQYSVEGRRVVVSNCDVLMEINDLLRPHVIHTEAFGKLWGTHPHEKKAKFTPAPPIQSSSALLTKLKTAMSVHPVQVIGNEGIAAASLLELPSELLFLHVLVLPTSVDVTIRSKDKSFTEVVMRYLHKLLR